MSGQATSPELAFNRAKHITYWKRCLKTYLPYQYTSMDANRMMLAYFTLFSLDVLNALDATLTADERENCLEWIYLCQHPNGGFRGSPPGAELGNASEEEQQRRFEDNPWDVATVPSTFFALSMLAILKDDFSRVRVKECLAWLRRMQRPDGSFGEHPGENDAVEGGMDTRFGFCAAGTRWMLRGRAIGDVHGVPDIDVDKLIECIRKAGTFDGGVSEMPFHEPHGGYTYCAVAALALIDGLPCKIQNSYSGELSTRRESGLSDLEYTTRWLLSRQTSELAPPGEEEDEDESDEEATQDNTNLRWAGFNGRCNKPADTCYSWWVSGSLSILSRLHLINTPPSRRYLLDKTQHAIGGFAKKPGDPPDIYHAALGLAALAMIEEEGLKKINASLCLSVEACAWVERLEWRKAVWDREESSGG